MSSWYEVYDNVDVQLMARKRAATMTAVVTFVIMFSITCLAVGLEGSLPLLVVVPLIAAAWLVFAWWAAFRYRSLRRLVWCVKLSDLEIVGYDYARRKSEIEWRDVVRIEITDRALVVVGSGLTVLEISHLFADFAELSHRLVNYAEDYGVPVHVDGRPWQQIDIYDVFPFLTADTPSSPTHGSASR